MYMLPEMKLKKKQLRTRTVYKCPLPLFLLFSIVNFLPVVAYVTGRRKGGKSGLPLFPPLRTPATSYACRSVYDATNSAQN